jgi:hypothetical protein
MAGGRSYAEGASAAPEWGVRFVTTPLFPLEGTGSSAGDGKGHVK